MRKIRGKTGEIVKVNENKKYSDLIEVQRDADRLFNFSAKETLNIM